MPGADSALIAQAASQLHSLSVLQRQLDGASPATIARLESEVLASVAGSYALAQQATKAATSPGQNMTVQQLAVASATARQEVQSISGELFQRHIFDPYLRFTSAEDEEAYRKRESEEKRYIDGELHKHTPEGDLNASGAVLRQLNDAEAHGAAASPAFQDMKKRATQNFRNLHEKMQAAGYSTTEADRLASESDPAHAPSRKLSAAEIDTRLDAKDDVIQKGSQDADLGDVIASLKAVGVGPAAQDNIGHGVGARDISAPTLAR